MTVDRGTRLGPYEVISLIGAGGMGEVHRARDTRLDRYVAIKVLSEHISSSPRSLARFHTEAKSIGKLSHPNILAIFDVELEHPPLFLVTELLEGETLRQAIQHSPLPWRRALEIGIAVADGLAAAHAEGIIHRDLKPENIFLTKQGAVKILDFGLAQFKREFSIGLGDSAETVSDAGLVVGTIGYLAPEQARGERVAAATDIFSFGCILYEMVSGRRAFHGSTPASTLAAILSNDEPSSIREYVGDLPADLELWLGRCLEKKPARRLQSAHDLGLVLRNLIGERPNRRELRRRVDAGIESLAVLPFVTSASSPDAEYLADGITESIINSLAQLKHLRVVARSTVYRHKGQAVDPIQVGRDLGVNNVLTGRIFQRGDVLVIAAELVDIRDGSQLWGQQYKRQLTDIFAIQEEISTEISGRLRLRFTAEEHSRLTKRYTENPEAYRLYLKGRYFWNKRTLEGMRTALQHFEQAVETDPSYARAHAGLADCMLMLAIYGDVDARKVLSRATAAQELALQIDPALAEAHASRGFSLLLFDWKFREAEQALRDAIELNAAYASAYQWLGFALGLTRRFGDARAAMKIAQELDPFSASINTTAVWPVYWAREFDEAIEGFRAAAELHPGYWVAHYYLGLSYAAKREYGQAILALRHAAEIGDSSWRYPGLAVVYAQADERERARGILAKLDEISSRQYVPPIHFAAVLASLGERDKAFEYLERSIRERNWQVAWLHLDPLWDSLRKDQRLRALQLQAGLPE